MYWWIDMWESKYSKRLTVDSSWWVYGLSRSHSWNFLICLKCFFIKCLKKSYCVKDYRHKRVQTVRLHLYDIQEQLTVISGEENENSDWQQGWELNRRGKRKYSRVIEMLYVVVDMLTYIYLLKFITSTLKICMSVNFD